MYDCNSIDELISRKKCEKKEDEDVHFNEKISQFDGKTGHFDGKLANFDDF